MPQDLNKPEVYVEALFRAATDPNPARLAAWIAGVDAVEGHPFQKWYDYFAQRLLDLAPRPELGFRSRTTRPAPAPKVGRNDPCPCGSGKKFKVCHINEEESVAWRLGSPTPAVEALAVSRLIHTLSPHALSLVPVDKASRMARLEMASAWHALEQPTMALSLLKGVLDMDRDDPHVLYDYWIARYAEWLVEAGREKEAEQFLFDEFDAAEGEGRWQIAQKIAAYYVDQGDTDNAMTWVETAFEGQGAENAFNHYLKGLILHTLENWEEARAAYENAERLSANFSPREGEALRQLLADGIERTRNQRPPDDPEPNPGEAEQDEEQAP